MFPTTTEGAKSCQTNYFDKVVDESLTALALKCAVLTRFVDSPELAKHADALLKSTLDILCGTSKHLIDMHGNGFLGEGVHGFASSLIKYLLATADAWMSRDTKRETLKSSFFPTYYVSFYNHTCDILSSYINLLLSTGRDEFSG